MNGRIHRVIFLLFTYSVSLVSSSSDLTLSSYVTSSDKSKLIKVFSDAWKLNNISRVHYAVASYKILKEPIPLAEKDLCKFLSKIGAKSDVLEQLYHVAATWNHLPACKNTILIQQLNGNVISKMEMTHENIFYLHMIKEYMGEKFAGLPSKLPDISVQSNESVINFGYALHVASLVQNQQSKNLLKKVEGYISHADELDGQYLQYEGGLSVTAFVISGIYKLSEAMNVAPPLTNSQLLKFTKYLMSHLSVNRPKGAFNLLQALSILVNNKFHMLVSIGCVSNSISAVQPTLQVRVSDLFGDPLFADKNNLFVSAESDNGLKMKLIPTTERAIYNLNVKEMKLGVGFHNVAVKLSIPTDKTNQRLPVNTANNILFKITSEILIDNFHIGVTDAEHASSQSLKDVNYPNTLHGELNVDMAQRFIIKFSLKDVNSGKLVRVHQPFIRFTHIEEEQEFHFVATCDSANNYRLQIDMKPSASLFQYLSGKYMVTVIVADSLMTTPIAWTVANVVLKFPDIEKYPFDDHFSMHYKPQPEIQHTFRQPEKRPPAIVSTVFSGLVLTPFIILLILWSKLGVNLKNCPISPSAIGFHIGLGGIFVLFGLFWLRLNMFETIRYLSAVGLLTFLCGNKMLVSIAVKRKS